MSLKKRKIKVSLGDLEKQQESLSSFMRSKHKMDITSKGNTIVVESNLSSEEFKKTVNKFIYRKNLTNQYWVDMEGDVIKIKKFEIRQRKKQRKKRIKPSTIKHGW